MRLIKIMNMPANGNPDPNGEEENIITTWALTEAQYHILLNYAVDSLLEKGFIEVTEMSEEELTQLRKEVEEDLRKQFASSEYDVPGLDSKKDDKVKKSLFIATNDKDTLH